MSDTDPVQNLSRWRHAFRKATSSQGLTSLLAIVVALVVGAILIAAADEGVR